jgi:hypothetical protein
MGSALSAGFIYPALHEGQFKLYIYKSMLLLLEHM